MASISMIIGYYRDHRSFLQYRKMSESLQNHMEMLGIRVK